MKSQNPILLVVNPISGSTDKDPIIKLVKKECETKNFSFNLYETSGENDAEEIKKIISEKNISRILVAGGDGTLQCVAHAINDTSITVGILSLGSSNGLALNLRIPETQLEQVKVALGDNFLLMDQLIINGKTCLHISDLGINAELIKNYEGSQIRGKLGYALQTIPTLLNCDYPFIFEIEVNGKTIKKEGILLAIANANKFGTGANINPSGKLDDGFFEVLIFKKLDIIEIFKTLYNDLVMDDEFVEVISTKRVVIKTTISVPFQIDGEFIGNVDEVNASLSYKKIKIAIP